jgi:NADP-dependent 3-hydroxy acid dehydrogenase YdfG
MFFQSVSPGAVETEIAEASEIPEDMLKVLKDIPYLKSKDIADAVIYVLGTPPHVQVGKQYVNIQSDSKLLSGSPWPISFKMKKNKIKLLRSIKM